MRKITFIITCFTVLIVTSLHAQGFNDSLTRTITDPAKAFLNPPESAKPGVLWMWMGSNLSKEGITKDLEALKKAGFNRTTMFSLADITTPWAGEIKNSPTPEFISWTEPWWKLVRYAAEESKRLGMDFGMFNGPGYESSGGPWISPELSMQEICFSETKITGNTNTRIQLKKPEVNPIGHTPYPIYNGDNGLVEIPEVAARKTFYKDICVLALPATGIVPLESVIDISKFMLPNGELDWTAPPGEWIIYRFGHTTTGTYIQPAQWKATGLECDKMSEAAVSFHINHVITEIKKHLGDLIGTGFTHVHFDSYEAGDPSWTPKMSEEFSERRGYNLLPYLPIFAGRTINSHEDSVKLKDDFNATIKDLHKDIYFTTLSKKLKENGLTFLCEPYGGPWRQNEIMPLIHNVMTEFWTNDGEYAPYELDPTVAALRKSGQNIIEAEAFTGQPSDSKWNETPEWLKPIGDAAFCAGVNNLVLHRFVHQAWDDKYKPAATMGRWGTHFDRTQTWWEPGKAMVKYWQRCQALLQWGRIAKPVENDLIISTKDSITVNSIHRKEGNTNIYFIANTSRNTGTATCTFKVSGMQPELWNPVTATMKDLFQFVDKNGSTSVTIPFDKAQSFFIVFRKKQTSSVLSKKNDFPSTTLLTTLEGAWQVQFDSAWGGPAKQVVFDDLQDWINNHNKGIKYYSGTAVYTKTFDLTAKEFKQTVFPIFLDLGVVKNIARVILNGKDLGVVWTAPWQIQLPHEILKNSHNKLVIEVTNVWANRLIGDEQEPSDSNWLPGHIDNGKYLKEFPEWFLKKQPRPSKNRYCFTTWNYFTKESELSSSGLLGPVQIIMEE
ncbi:alpha-L-rhamnosidase [Flavobacterium gillisiae]|uniref:Alpha-L-rhamnosidase n=1 Tax=Flavobacterium gillisiae TaxID=150146 RepID=A0A1H4F986_9FLAO|nr:glycosyl hydrolase [Flavobacterium gillisiae]SEA93042.1 alpha-L-rhamnosidase [Flavobacterium gillisiae]